MSDRIGVMRAGKLLQVGSPNDIYTAPKTKFVSEFMGDVNIIPVKSDGNGALVAMSLETKFAAPAGAPRSQSGHLVIRPEFVRFLSSPDEAPNCLAGQLYNEYALGSRIQYQVRVGEHVFVVEKLRQQAYSGKLDDQVLIGWDTQHSIFVSEE